VPLPHEAIDGCRFHPRCTLRVERCLAETPLLLAVASDHSAACWRADEIVNGESR
jgi:oligopeptide/dipeptide ABC transporter ATP-binding protein